MKPTIMDGSKAPAVIIQTPEVQPAPAPQSSTKKYVVLGVAAVLVTMILTAGIVSTAVVFSKSSADIIKSTMAFKDAKGVDASEEIEADVEHNTAKYTVRGENGKMTIVHDFNKRLGVMVFHDADEPYCAVHFLNTTSSSIEESKKKEESSANKVNVTIVRDLIPVVDTTFLPTEAQTICGSLDTFWVTERYGEVPADANGEHREREGRDIHVYRYIGSYFSYGCRCWVHVYRYAYTIRT